MGLKIKNKNGEWESLPVIKGEKGDSYILTDADKEEIAALVASSFVDAEGVNY